MTVRCDLTDLLVDQCACPQHRGEPAPAHEVVEIVGQPFTAQWPGKCAGCGGRFDRGDQITRAADRSGYVHADQRECR